MKMTKLTLTILFFGLTLFVGTTELSAQSTPAREAWAKEVVAEQYGDLELTAKEKVWVVDILIRSCACSKSESQEAMDACGNELLQYAGLPQTEEDFRSITPEQQRKLKLLEPITSISTCPE